MVWPRAAGTHKSHGYYILTRRRGADTAHTQMGRPTYEAPTRESTHTNTHKHKQTHNAARQSTVRFVATSCTHPFEMADAL